MIGRLLSALLDIAQTGETLAGQLLHHGDGDASSVRLRLNRPLAIRHSTAADLLDPGFSPDGEAPGAAHLGLGFSLRLVTNLARGAGGDFVISANGLTLSVPSRLSRLVDGEQAVEPEQA